MKSQAVALCAVVAVLTWLASASAQDRIEVKSAELSVRADTSAARELRVAQVIELRAQALKGNTVQDVMEPATGFWIVKGGKRLYHIPQAAEAKKHGFQVVIPIDQGTFAAFKNVDDCKDCSLEADGAVELPAESAAGADNGTFRIAPDELAQATRGRIGLSREYLNGLRRTYGADGTGFKYDNRFDVNRRVDDQAKGHDIYTTTFALTSPWIRPSNFLRLTGQWSTQPHDSLNRIYFYPANLTLWSQKSAVSSLQITSGIETGSGGAAQYGRGAAALVYTTLTPNLVDFTAGANRFRPDPVLGVGVKGLVEWAAKKIPGDDRRWGEAFASVQYYVPVFGEYAAKVEASTYYPFKRTASRDDWKYLYSLTLGTTIKGLQLKPLLKYTRGADDVNGRDLTQVLIGLLYDIIPKQEGGAKGGE